MHCISMDLTRYKLMESFDQISESFFKLFTIFKNISGVEFIRARRGMLLNCTEEHES